MLTLQSLLQGVKVTTNPAIDPRSAGPPGSGQHRHEDEMSRPTVPAFSQTSHPTAPSPTTPQSTTALICLFLLLCEENTYSSYRGLGGCLHTHAYLCRLERRSVSTVCSSPCDCLPGAFWEEGRMRWDISLFQSCQSLGLPVLPLPFTGALAALLHPGKVVQC